MVDIYDDATGQWSTATLAEARCSLAATTLGTQALFAGGCTVGNGKSDLVDLYDDGR